MNKAPEEGWKRGVAHAMADGIITPPTRKHGSGNSGSGGRDGDAGNQQSAAGGPEAMVPKTLVA